MLKIDCLQAAWFNRSLKPVVSVFAFRYVSIKGMIGDWVRCEKLSSLAMRLLACNSRGMFHGKVSCTIKHMENYLRRVKMQFNHI